MTGSQGFEALCRQLDVPYRKTGKLLVAFDQADLAVLRRLPPADIVLVVGFRDSPWPKIALYRRDAGQLRAAGPAACAALVTDTPLVCACPVFPLDDPEPLAAWLTNRRHGKDDPIVHHH